MPDFALPPRELVLVVHERLCRTYGCPVPYFRAQDPLSELIAALLSHRTKNADSRRAFQNLRERFHTWAELREAPVEEIEELIASATWPEQKAPRLKAVLEEITWRRNGELSLEFLASWSEELAEEWLAQVPGIGPKTSAAVLSFSSLRKRALPVDSHHHRVVQRLGLIGAKLAVGPAHKVLKALLPREWDAQKLYDHHEIMMFHGKRCCYHHSPDCHRCVLLELCPTGRARLKLEPVRPLQGELF